MAWFPPGQLIPSAGHRHQTDIRPGSDPVKGRHLHKGFEHHLFLAGDGARSSIAERSHPAQLLFSCRQVGTVLLVALGSPAGAAQPSGTFLLPGRERRCLLPELLLPLEQTGQLLRITACKLLFQRLDAAQTGGALGTAASSRARADSAA